MALDAGGFCDAPGPGLLPLYEAKMVHQFDHRWATYEERKKDGTPGTRELVDEEKLDPDFTVLPRYWVRESDVEERLAERWTPGWLLGWRDISNATNERTVISAVIPRVGVGHVMPLVLPETTPSESAVFLANLNSHILDYCARQKAGSTHITFGLLRQLPLVPPDTTLRDWIADRVLELSYTAWDLQPFAQDLGYDGPPFRWDPERRFEIRCELDAAYFHLYEIERDDVDYIMSTFPIVQRKDEAAHGHYRTRDRILEIYDAMASGEWQSSLDPPVADPRAAHPAES